jgi:hypothetical protein
MPSQPQLITVVGWLGCHYTPMQAPACPSNTRYALEVFQS